MDRKRYLTLATALATAVFAVPALAVTTTTLVITQAQENVPQGRIQLFDADTGAEVKAADDDDDESVLFLLDGGSYRVAVDGKTVREITVSGDGSRTFVIEVPTGASAPATAGDPRSELTAEQRAAIREIMAPFAPPPTPESGSLLVDIFFGGGIGRSEVPQTSGGVIRTNSGDEVPAGLGPKRLNTMFLEGGIMFPVGGVPAFIDGRYTAGNSRSAPFTVAPGSADAAGFSFGEETDDSTGLILGNFGGVTGTLAADFDEVSLRFGVRLPLGANDGGSVFSISPFARFNRRTTQLDSDLFLTTDIPNFNFDIGQTREDRLRDTWYTVGIIPRIDIPLAPAVSVHLDVTGEAGIFRSRLDSIERNRCDLCGPSHQNFTIETVESDSSFRFRGGAGAGLTFQISPQFRLGLAGRAEFTPITGVSHPVTGDDVLAGNTTRLERENDFGLSFGVSMESWW
jgi:hypothetical protein